MPRGLGSFSSRQDKPGPSYGQLRWVFPHDSAHMMQTTLSELASRLFSFLFCRRCSLNVSCPASLLLPLSSSLVSFLIHPLISSHTHLHPLRPHSIQHPVPSQTSLNRRAGVFLNATKVFVKFIFILMSVQKHLITEYILSSSLLVH